MGSSLNSFSVALATLKEISVINTRLIKLICVMFLAGAIGATLVLGQSTPTQDSQLPRDPGVRGGAPGGGQRLPGLQVNEAKLFEEGLKRANELEATCDTCSDVTPGGETGEDPLLATKTNSAGLGSRFNGDQCIVCHSQPAIGGSGGFLVPNPGEPNLRPPENPMFDLIPHRKGATNRVPSFITQFGPIREVRFARRPDGRPDGGVHQLFTVVGRSDVFPASRPGSCSDADLPQPDFETEYRNGNLRFRIPLQLFGLGIIDGIQDREIIRRYRESTAIRAQLGIGGGANR